MSDGIATTTQTVNVTVNQINDTPTMNAISDQAMNMFRTGFTNTPLAVSFVVGDLDGPLTCSGSHLSYSSSTPSLVASTNAVVWSGTWPNCIGTISPVVGQFGSANVTFQITDGVTTPASRTFMLTVQDTRSATSPVISGSATVTSNVTDFILSGSCTPGYTVKVYGDVNASDIIAPSGSVTQTCNANGAFSYTIRKSGDNQYTFNVNQLNPNQLPSPPTVSNSASKLWTRDSQAPNALTLSTPTSNPTNSRDVSFSFTGTCEPETSVNMSAMGGATPPAAQTVVCSQLGTFSMPVTIGNGVAGNAANNGTYVFTLYQQDSALNRSPDITFTWVADSSIPPTPILTSPTTNPFFTKKGQETTTPTIAGNCIFRSTTTNGESDNNLVFIEENGAEITPSGVGIACASNGTFSLNVPSRTDGNRTYTIYQQDPVAEKNSASVSFVWTRDTQDPASLQIINPTTSSVTTPNSIFVSGTCESNTTVKVKVNSVDETSAFVSCVSSKFQTVIYRSGATQTYTLTLTQTDAAGNTSPTSTITWTQNQNSTAVPSVTSPAGGSITNNASILNIQGVCQPGNLLVLEGSSPTTLTSSEMLLPSGTANNLLQTCPDDGKFYYTLQKFSDSAYSFNIKQSKDNGSNWSIATPVTWTRDTTPPVVTLTAAATNTISFYARFTFEANANESVSRFECSLDGGGYATCTSPYAVKVANGSHSFSVRAVDVANNWSVIVTSTWTTTAYATANLWHFENATDDTHYNQTTYPNSWTGSGGTFGTTNAKFGKGLITADNTTQYTITHNATHNAYLSEATIEFWAQTGSAANMRILTKGSTTSSDFSWSIETFKRNKDNNNILFKASLDGATSTTFTAIDCVRKNTAATHIAITFNQGNVAIYCNGSRKTQGVIGTDGSSRLFESGSNLTFGATSGGYKGVIDELRISQTIRYTGATFTIPTSAFTKD